MDNEIRYVNYLGKKFSIRDVCKRIQFIMNLDQKKFASFVSSVRNHALHQIYKKHNSGTLAHHFFCIDYLDIFIEPELLKSCINKTASRSFKKNSEFCKLVEYLSDVKKIKNSKEIIITYREL